MIQFNTNKFRLKFVFLDLTHFSVLNLLLKKINLFRKDSYLSSQYYSCFEVISKCVNILYYVGSKYGQ